MRDLVGRSSVFYLGNFDEDEYRDDFKKIIKEREQNRIGFLHQSPQISFRATLIQYLKKVCLSKMLSHSCLHLSIYLLDLFMDNHHIIPERLLLVANVCLLLAAKLEENSIKVPKIPELNSLVDEKYTIIDYINLEILIIKFFRFFVKFPCAVHYVFYYMQEIISKDDLTSDNYRSLFYQLHESVVQYLDQILENVHYMQCYQPSKLAAAVIAATRLKNGLNVWTKPLEDLTDYSKNELDEIIQNLVMYVTWKK